ncbi:unannotated protein [freshwater metagenome]|uniref:Unannotated protein n=1 Tax=freshwater metagenome TaxID=449393 RepID=A0A6J6ESE7_9ZZZZ
MHSRAIHKEPGNDAHGEQNQPRRSETLRKETLKALNKKPIRDDDREGQDEVSHVEIVGVEDGNHGDANEVIDDRQGQQEGPQSNR